MIDCDDLTESGVLQDDDCDHWEEAEWFEVTLLGTQDVAWVCENQALILHEKGKLNACERGCKLPGECPYYVKALQLFREQGGVILALQFEIGGNWNKILPSGRITIEYKRDSNIVVSNDRGPDQILAGPSTTTYTYTNEVYSDVQNQPVNLRIWTGQGYTNGQWLQQTLFGCELASENDRVFKVRHRSHQESWRVVTVKDPTTRAHLNEFINSISQQSI